MQDIQRGYISVGGRRVHYRRAGNGPPLVMLHGSPGDSEMLVEEMSVAARRFTCFALDTPGFGGSDPLPGQVLTVRDLAQATAEAIEALRLTDCRVYGTHTGAAIAAELGVGWPERISGLVIEGLPIFTEAEIAVLFEGYFQPMVADPLGGHLTATWTRFRDQFTWFPWRSRDVTRLNPVDRPTPEEIDHWVSMFYRSCKTYGPAYKAACYYGHGAYVAAEALTLPAVFMASAEDMLFPHLDRLPPLKSGQRIERLPYDPKAKYESIADFAGSLPGGFAPAPGRRGLVFAGSDPALGFMDVEGGQVFVRAYGSSEKPPLILLHDLPGTGLGVEDQARALAEHAWVIVPDLLGAGKSSAVGPEPCAVERCAEAVTALVDALGLQSFLVASLGLGGAIAAALAARNDPRLTALFIEALPRIDPDQAEQIAPEIQLTPEGSHWIKAWLMLRDGQIYDPWFDGRVGAQRKDQGCFDADWLHDQTVALMNARAVYHHLPRAAAAYDTVQTLNRSKTPVQFAERGDLRALLLALRLENETPT
jgi:pimeloyl-ACP methyl ester carboxylesterase